MKELQSVLKFFNSFTGGHYAERHCMHDYKISIKWKQQIFIKFFWKKNRLSGTCLYIILIIIKYVTINELMI